MRAPGPRTLLVAGACALAAALVLLWRFDPAASAFYPPCLFRLATGFQCPGCGTARGLHALLHGRVADAWRLNPLLFLVAPVLVFESVLESTGMRRVRVPVAVLVLALAGTLVFGVLRNLP